MLKTFVPLTVRDCEFVYRDAPPANEGHDCALLVAEQRSEILAQLSERKKRLGLEEVMAADVDMQ